MSAPFWNCCVISRTNSADELLYSLVLFKISVDWAPISATLLGVLGSHRVGPGGGGDGVQGFTSSLDITTSGLFGTKPVAQKLDWILPDENTLSNT